MSEPHDWKFAKKDDDMFTVEAIRKEIERYRSIIRLNQEMLEIIKRFVDHYGIPLQPGTQCKYCFLCNGYHSEDCAIVEARSLIERAEK